MKSKLEMQLKDEFQDGDELDFGYFEGRHATQSYHNILPLTHRSPAAISQPKLTVPP